MKRLATDPEACDMLGKNGSLEGCSPLMGIFCFWKADAAILPGLDYYPCDLLASYSSIKKYYLLNCPYRSLQ